MDRTGSVKQKNQVQEIMAAKEATEGGEAVRRTVEAMKSITQKISIIDDIIKKTSDLMQDIAVSQEQSSGAGEIDSAISRINQTSQQNAASAEEPSSTAELLSGQSQQISHMTAFFKIDGVEEEDVRESPVAVEASSKPAFAKA